MKGILFNSSTGMLKTVIEGKKTMTRRLGGIKPEINNHPDNWKFSDMAHYIHGVESSLMARFYYPQKSTEPLILDCKPRYEVGEVLYIKESHALNNFSETESYGNKHAYKVDWNEITCKDLGIKVPKWSNALFCGEKEARYFIRITRIKVERLQDIDVIDCEKEGIYPYEESEDYPDYSYKDILNMDDWGVKTPMESFASLINKINGINTWKNNLWCFVYEFEKVK